MNEPANPNSIEVTPEGIIEVRLIGDQTYQTIDETGKQCAKTIEQVRFRHQPVLGIVDFSEQKHFNTGSNKAALEVLSRVTYDKLAIVGEDTITREVGGLIVKALGKNDSTKLFPTRDAAVAWLLMRDPLAG